MGLLDRLSKDYGVPVSFLQSRIISKASHLYKTYEIDKKYSKNSEKKTRTIHHPSAELKNVQLWLNEKILNSLPVHEKVFSYRKGRSIFDAVKLHTASKYFLKLDFKDFFPSIKRNDIVDYLNGRDGIDYNDAVIISDLVTRNGGLTIGSPASPVLSNSILYKFDESIYQYCESKKVVYTRYADDLFFSSTDPEVLVKVESFVRQALNSFSTVSLRINEDKTKYLSHKQRVRILGLIISSDGRVSVGRDKKREIRQMVYQWKTGQLVADDTYGEKEKRQYLKGYLSFLSSIEPKFVAMLAHKYGAEILEQIKNSDNN